MIKTTSDFSAVENNELPSGVVAQGILLLVVLVYS